MSFPAQYARDHGMMILVGAPNVLRGSSQSGNISARDLVEAGLADGICADYHAPCLIPSAFKLVELGLCDLPTAIAKVTRNPAQAVGLGDRREIAIGNLADLAIVRVDELGIPQVEATFLEGRLSLTFARYPSAMANELAYSMNGLQVSL